MKIPRGLKRLNYAIQNDRRNRDVFYAVLQKQLSIGQSLERSILRMGEIMPNNSVAKTTAKVAVDLQGTGLMLTEGWDREALLPEYDAQLLRVAEEQGRLPEVLRELSGIGEIPVNLFHRVIKPGLYPFGFMLVIALIASVMSSTIYEQFVGRYPDILDEQLGYQMSLFFRQWLVWILAGLVGLVALYTWSGRWVTGNSRRILRFIYKDIDRQQASRFLYLNELLSRQGASSPRVIEVCQVLMKGRHIQTMLKRVQIRLREGESYFDSIRDRMVPMWAANMAQALAPGDDPKLLPESFDATRLTMDARAGATYSLLSSVFNLTLMFAAVSILGNTILGLYDSVMMMTERMAFDY